MAKDSSFDVTSTVDLQEVDNALDQAKRELITRYDFKGIPIEFKREENTIKISVGTTDKVEPLNEMLKQKFIRREVPLKNLEFKEPEISANGSAKYDVEIGMGLPTEIGKEISKYIRDLKMKVQASIQGDIVRVSGKKKDDLQEVMDKLKGQDFKRALQFENYR